MLGHAVGRRGYSYIASTTKYRLVKKLDSKVEDRSFSQQGYLVWLTFHLLNSVAVLL